MEEIKGKDYKTLKKEKNFEKINDLFKKSIIICYLLDKINLNKFEMNRPNKHIIYSNKKVYFIDFERSTISNKTKNLTQFVDFIIKEKRGKLNKEEIEKTRLLLKKYKKNKDWNIVKEILKVLKID